MFEYTVLYLKLYQFINTVVTMQMSACAVSKAEGNIVLLFIQQVHSNMNQING